MIGSTVITLCQMAHRIAALRQPQSPLTTISRGPHTPRLSACTTQGHLVVARYHLGICSNWPVLCSTLAGGVSPSWWTRRHPPGVVAVCSHGAGVAAYTRGVRRVRTITATVLAGVALLVLYPAGHVKVLGFVGPFGSVGFSAGRRNLIE
jgi:hypothetical protein